MLISFTASNFRSIKNSQEFSFATSSDRAHTSTHCLQTGVKSIPQLSKAAVLFGPNGSGKSNFLGALGRMRDLVLHSTSLTDTEFADRYTPFVLGQADRQPTAFAVDVLLGTIRYRYGFSYDGTRICSERLDVRRTGKSQRWFERATDSLDHRTTWAPFSHHFRGARHQWREATRAQSLFLTAGSVLDSDQLAPLFCWFEQSVELVGGTAQSDWSQIAICLRDQRVRDDLVNFLRSAGLQVNDVRLSPAVARLSHSEQSQLGDRRAWRPVSGVLEFSHFQRQGSPQWIDFVDESAGIQRLVSWFCLLTSAIAAGKLVLADEFDVGLHPLVARHLLSLIHGRAILSRGAQLLLTSQNSTLMDTQVLRRDEIWLMQLNDSRASELHRVSDLPAPPRKGEAIGKQYLNGRYGAIPSVEPYSPTLSP